MKTLAQSRVVEGEAVLRVGGSEEVVRTQDLIQHPEIRHWEETGLANIPLQHLLLLLRLGVHYLARLDREEDHLSLQPGSFPMPNLRHRRPR